MQVGFTFSGDGEGHQSLSRQLSLSTSLWCFRKATLRLKLSCPRTCLVGESLLVKGEFWTDLGASASTSSSKKDDASNSIHVSLDLECRARAGIEDEKKKAEKTLFRTRYTPV